VGFECFRCTRKVIDEEGYLLFGRYYCRACYIAIENDPEYRNILLVFNKVSLDDIENY